MEFRRATIDDIPDLQKLIARAINSITREGYTKEDLENWIRSYTYESTLERKIEDPDSYYILLTDQGSIIGTGILTTTEIHGVYADPESPVPGIGTRIMDHLEKKARDSGIQEINIRASVTAAGFYKARGYIYIEDMEFDLEGYMAPGKIMIKKIVP